MSFREATANAFPPSAEQEGYRHRHHPEHACFAPLQGTYFFNWVPQSKTAIAIFLMTMCTALGDLVSAKVWSLGKA